MRRFVMLATAGAVLAAGSLALPTVATAVPVRPVRAARTVRLSDKLSPVGHPVATAVATFKTGATLPKGDKLTRYTVNFGDHSKKVTGTKLPKSLSHRYSHAGRYPVTLSLTDKHKHTVTTTTHVIVTAAKAAAGGATTSIITPPAPVSVPVTPPASTPPPTPPAAGAVLGWGTNDAGELGNNTTTTTGCRCGTAGPVLSLTNVTAVVGGATTSYALEADHTVWSWGADDTGQLGGSALVSAFGCDCLTEPARIPTLAGVTQVAAGIAAAYALESDGSVWSWGRDSSGELGNGTVEPSGGTPAQVTGLPTTCRVTVGKFSLNEPCHVVEIAASDDNGYALVSDGSVWAWGDDAFGELGPGVTLPISCSCRSGAAQVSGLSGIAHLAAGGNSAYALASDGSVWAWGNDFHGELGNNTAGTGSCSCSATAVKVNPVAGGGATGVAAAREGAYLLEADGTVWSWGYDEFGELGSGTTIGTGCACISTPVQVSGLTDVTAIAASSDDGYALRPDGSVWAWGDNGGSELDRSSTTTPASDVPVQLGLGTGVSAIGAAHDTAYAVVG